MDKIKEIDFVVNVELACLEKWLQGNKPSLNLIKTLAMIIGSAQKQGKIDKESQITSCFQVNGNGIDIVYEAKYLGVMIDENSKRGSQTMFLQKKISRTLVLLKYPKQFVLGDTLRKMYLSIVEPHMSYCYSVLGCCADTKLNTLEKLQKRAERIVTNSPIDSSAASLLPRLGWIS